MSIQDIIDWSELDKSARQKLIARPNVAIDGQIRTTVEAILDKVETSGDEAIKKLVRPLALDFRSNRIPPLLPIR